MTNVASGLFREFKANPHLIPNSPSEATQPQRFGVKGYILIGGLDGRVHKYETSAERRDVANATGAQPSHCSEIYLNF
jgi:hypothetical protein